MNNYLEENTIIYPIPGHSYLDCDRDFGRIEKKQTKDWKSWYSSMG
jgi:hypothetical protein